MARTVLCVDSDRNLCQVIATALESEGWQVATEFDGERALAAVSQDAPDLLLIDLFLPRRDGFAVLEAIRALPEPVRNTPVVLLSSCSVTPEYTQRAERLGAAALLAKPVPLDKLAAVVAEQLGEPKPEVPVETGRAARPARTDLEGSLERFSFAALLHHLHGLRATGVLHLEVAKKRKWLQLRDGYPTAVRSNLVNECLGNYLVRAGRINQRDLAESRRRMSRGRRQGEILVAMQVLSEDDVSQALRDHAEEKLLEIFRWTNGRFRFQFGAQLDRASGLAKRSPANLILEGVRTRMALSRIDAWFDANAASRVARGEEPFYRFQEVDLRPEHRALLERCGDGRPLGDFRRADEVTRRALYGLVRTGLLELRRDDGTPRAAKPAARPAPKPVPRVEPSPAPKPAPRAAPIARATAAEDESMRADLASAAERFAGLGCFEILGVVESASDDEIRAAYERLAERYHPDRVQASSHAVRDLAERVMAFVEEAHQTLADPRRRAEYRLDRKKADRKAAEREQGLRAVEAERRYQDGEAALRARSYELALRCFGKALELNPDEGEYVAQYGWALHLCHPDDAQIAEEAIEHIKRGIKLAADREKPYLLMGRLCKATGRTQAAEKMFTRAVQLQPDCVEALRELRLINMRREKNKGFIGRLLRR
jgi:CheY-like chemotaxis protein/DnaJ-domain-containing protein 1